jgi:hypothetical protein
MDFKAGDIRLLFHLGYYDGLLSGVGKLNKTHDFVFFEAEPDCGNKWVLKDDFKKIQEKLFALDNNGEESENIWDLLEFHFEDEMYDFEERIYDVYILENHEEAIKHHREFQLHVGNHTDYFYKDGKPMRGGDSYVQSPGYYQPHFYDRNLKWKPNKKEFLGKISYTTLFEVSDIPDSKLVDPRSEELKKYQKGWKRGDKLILDW